jgi:hypothetical protein
MVDSYSSDLHHSENPWPGYQHDATIIFQPVLLLPPDSTLREIALLEYFIARRRQKCMLIQLGESFRKLKLERRSLILPCAEICTLFLESIRWGQGATV